LNVSQQNIEVLSEKGFHNINSDDEDSGSDKEDENIDNRPKANSAIHS